MQHLNPLRLVWTALAAAVLALPGGAGAVAIGLSPSSQDVEVGDVASVDVVFSDLGDEVISAYDLDVTYDASILRPREILFGSALGEAAFLEVFEAGDLSLAGVVDLAALSLLDDDTLALLQGGGPLAVATLVFDTIAAGTAELDFAFDAFNDVKGRDAAVLGLDVSGATIAVAGDGGGPGGPGPGSPIPEPSAALAFALGAALVLVALRERGDRIG